MTELHLHGEACRHGTLSPSAPCAHGHAVRVADVRLPTPKPDFRCTPDIGGLGWAQGRLLPLPSSHCKPWAPWPGARTADTPGGCGRFWGAVFLIIMFVLSCCIYGVSQDVRNRNQKWGIKLKI